MPIKQHEKYTGEGFHRDAEGYLVLHNLPSCVRCHDDVGRIADDDKRRRFQILGYCERCQQELLGF